MGSEYPNTKIFYPSTNRGVILYSLTTKGIPSRNGNSLNAQEHYLSWAIFFSKNFLTQKHQKYQPNFTNKLFVRNTTNKTKT